jgi:hypothetical protein
MRVYITFCSARKDDALKCSNRAVTPDLLYTSRRIQGFIRRAKEKNVCWAILSDHYGVWFSHETHVWYEKHPDSVTEQEFAALRADFDKQLGAFNEIFFCPGTGDRRIHRLYKRLLEESKLKNRIQRRSYSEIN